MVTNSLGKGNFMQPMGRHSMHSNCVDFFSLKFWVGGGRIFFNFLVFPICSLEVPNGFPIFCPKSSPSHLYIYIYIYIYI